jgi:inorganic pyrophosphatase
MPTKTSPQYPIPPIAAGGLIHVIIDTPGGTGNKYKYDLKSGLFRLSRILPSGMHFPCDFGFIPGTVGDDGDALDVAVISEVPSFVGCLMCVRLLGIIVARQTEKAKTIRNDRLLAVPVTPVNKPRQRGIRDVAVERLAALEEFFILYNRAQGRTFKPEGRRGARAAHRALHVGIDKYDAALT